MIGQSVKMAFKSLWSSKGRSFLTMLGVIIGVSALIVLVSLVRGATGSVTDSINSMGTDYMTVSITGEANNSIRWDEVSELLSDSDTFALSAPTAQESLTATSSLGEETVSVTGTTPGYQTIMGLELSGGRFFLTPDLDNHTSVAVINSDLATDLLGRTDVTGEEITIGGRKFTVIGVLDDSDSVSDDQTSYAAYIPYTSLMRISDQTGSKISSFVVSVSDGQGMDAAEEELDLIMQKRLSVTEDDADSMYRIMNQSVIADALSDVTTTLTLLLGAIAGISLLVGGIGIMNIMLVSVSERTREIGVRKAIGARPSVIMMQFLIEALVLSLFGCLLGVLLSKVILIVVNVVGDVDYSMALPAVLIAAIFSLVMGLIFGLYPAGKAARKKPIEALRAQ